MNETQNDHDLLIQIATKLDRAILDIKELKDNTTARVAALEAEKANQTDLAAIVKKVESLQRIVYIGLGISIALQFVITIYSNLHK